MQPMMNSSKSNSHMVHRSGPAPKTESDFKELINFREQPMSLSKVNSANKTTLGNFNVSVFQNKKHYPSPQVSLLACAKNFTWKQRESIVIIIILCN